MYVVLKQQSYLCSIIFAGTEYWRLDFTSEPSVDSSYPQSISKKWSSLLENGIDATFHLEDNDTYFFKGDQYYHYNGEVSKVRKFLFSIKKL